MVIDKELAEKAQRERYVVLETGVSEGKKAEKREMEKMLQSMIVKIEEMNGKIKKMEVKQEEERMAIKDMGESIIKMMVDLQSGEISEEVKVELSEKIMEMEKEKKQMS